MNRVFRSAVAIGCFAALMASGVTIAGAAPGNNGTVKIDGTDVDHIPNNAPHQGCSFDIEFYNFDVGSPDASYSFTLWSPTHSPTDDLVASGTVAIGGGPLDGFKDLDAAVTVDLSAGLAASGAVPVDQGYHVRLDVNTPDQHGNGSKSKVVWISKDCGIILPG